MTQKIGNVSLRRLICNCKSRGNVANSPTNINIANKGMTIHWELYKYLIPIGLATNWYLSPIWVQGKFYPIQTTPHPNLRKEIFHQILAVLIPSDHGVKSKKR